MTGRDLALAVRRGCGVMLAHVRFAHRGPASRYALTPSGFLDPWGMSFCLSQFLPKICPLPLRSFSAVPPRPFSPNITATTFFLHSLSPYFSLFENNYTAWLVSRHALTPGGGEASTKAPGRKITRPEVIVSVFLATRGLDDHARGCYIEQ